MIPKRSKVYVPQYYVQIKYKIITFKEGVLITEYQNFNYDLKNKQNKLRQTKKDKIKVM